MWCRLAQSAISWCIESTSWLMFMDWCIDVLVGVLSRHVGWRLLMHWRIDWCIGFTCWFTFTDTMTCWLVCWIDMLVDYHWFIDMMVGVLDQLANVCIVLLNAIAVDQLSHLVMKRNKKKTIYLLHIEGWLKTCILV